MALRASLDALPNELLYEILEHLTKERDAAVPRRYQMLTTFASLNRRFRQFALPHSFKELRVPNHNRLPAMFEFFRHHLSLIRVLRVGNPILRRPSSPRPRPPHGWNPYCDQLLPGARQFVLLENLVNFDCVGFCFEPTELAEVFGASNSRLQSLRLGWDWRHLFPFEALPSLENLSIHVIARPNSGCWQKELSYYDPVHPCTFPSLTTLSIIDAFLWFDQTICGEVTFPALRKFHLLPRSPDCCVRILGFISDHPGLLEVDIPRMYLNFPDLINLAKSERKTSWHTRSTIRARGAPLSGAIIPDPIYDTDFMRWKGLELAGFSFIRAARKQPEDPADPVAPHKLTELSIQTSPDHESLLLQGIGALGRVPLLADCTRLSLVISDAHNEEDPDMESVESIIVGLFLPFFFFFFSRAHRTVEYPQYEPHALVKSALLLSLLHIPRV
ncbi:hypothetical protein FB451DRAFT_1219871 [Mycena latifolia]|nr:hypothetical protein FB451DRAFT_1219871 [Mycena latifolia]